MADSKDALAKARKAMEKLGDLEMRVDLDPYLRPSVKDSFDPSRIRYFSEDERGDAYGYYTGKDDLVGKAVSALKKVFGEPGAEPDTVYIRDDQMDNPYLYNHEFTHRAMDEDVDTEHMAMYGADAEDIKMDGSGTYGWSPGSDVKRGYANRYKQADNAVMKQIMHERDSGYLHGKHTPDDYINAIQLLRKMDEIKKRGSH